MAFESRTGSAGSSSASPQAAGQPDVEALKDQVRALSSKLRAWEKIGRVGGGEVFTFDDEGNPTGFNLESEPAPAVEKPLAVPTPAYMTQEQFQTQLAQVIQALQANTLGNLHLFRGLDKTLSSKDYSELTQYDSPWSKKTAEVLQAKRWGIPLEGATSWDQWQYQGMDSFQTAADIAQTLLMREAKQAEAQQAVAKEAEDKAKAAQGAAGLSPTPGTGGTGGGGGGRPDFRSLQSPEEITAALSASMDNAP